MFQMHPRLYRNDLVINLGVKCVQNKTCADTLDLMRACFSLRKYRRSCRLNSNYLHIRVLALQVLTCTGDRSACADTCYENVYLSVCVIPDLRTCCCCMCLRVSRVLKLSRDEASRNLLGELFCLGNGTFIPLAPSVRTTSAPYAFRMFLLSTLMVSGMVRIVL